MKLVTSTAGARSLALLACLLITAQYSRRVTRAVVIPPGEGVRLGNVEFLGLSEHSPRLNVSVITMAPGADGPESHVHADEDDAFYILDGKLTFLLDEGDVAAPEGTFVLVPPGVTRVLNIHAPAGFDRRLLGE